MAEEKKKNNLITVELFGMAFALFASLGFLCLSTGDAIFGDLGDTVRKFFLGTLGYWAFPVLILIVYLGIKAVIGFKIQNENARRILIYGILYLFFISLLIHTLTTSVAESKFGDYVSFCYRCGASFKTCTLGGALCGIIVWVICQILSPVGAYVFYGMALTLLTLLLLRGRFANADIASRNTKKSDKRAKNRKKVDKKAKKSEKPVDFDVESPIADDDFLSKGKTDEAKPLKKRTLGLSDEDFELKSEKDKRREKDRQSSLRLMFGGSDGFGTNNKNGTNAPRNYTVDLTPNKSYQDDYDADIEQKTQYVRQPSSIKGVTVNSPMGLNEEQGSYNTDRSVPLDVDLSDYSRETYVVNNGGRSRENISSFDRVRGDNGGDLSGYSRSDERYVQTDLFGDSADGGRSTRYGDDYSFGRESSDFTRSRSAGAYSDEQERFSAQRNESGDLSGSERRDYSERRREYSDRSGNVGGRLQDIRGNFGGDAFGSDLSSRANFEPTDRSRFVNSVNGEDDYRGEANGLNGYSDRGGRSDEYSADEMRRRENLRRLRGEEVSQEKPEKMFSQAETDERNSKNVGAIKELNRARRASSGGNSEEIAKPTFKNGDRTVTNTINNNEKTVEVTERIYVPQETQPSKQPEVNVTVNNVTPERVQKEKIEPEKAQETATFAPKQISLADLPKENQLVNPIDKMPSNYRFHFPPLKLLDDYIPDEESIRRNRLEQESRKETILSILNQSNINPTIEEVKIGPTITRFEISIPHTVPVKKLLERQEDLNLWLAARDKIRIVSPIPGTSRIGIEVPNSTSTKVGLKSVISSKKFKEAPNDSLICCLGKDMIGNIVTLNISEMPHLLVAGATGTGKSVFLNCLLVSLMYKYTPEELRIVVVDPKIVGFTAFKGVPHLLFDEIITEQRKALSMLEWAVKEMNERYLKFGEYNTDAIKDYNKCMIEDGKKPLYRILIIIDEFADLMASASDRKLMENKIGRLAAKARAAGIHLIFAAQRPSADVVDGSIKTNFASRMAFKMSSGTDAQVVMGETGAEKLLGYGDVMYRVGKMSFTERGQGALIEKPELVRVCKYLRENNKCYYDEFAHEMINKGVEDENNASEAPSLGASSDGENLSVRSDEEIIKRAMRIAIRLNNVSGSMLQRKLGLGYPKAAKIMDKLSERRYIGEAIDNRHREIFMTREQFKEIFGEDVDAAD